jgi:hypothetical protein
VLQTKLGKEGKNARPLVLYLEFNRTWIEDVGVDDERQYFE